jgi:Reverse transcriptase (RNA-dependent DNA polymerase)
MNKERKPQRIKKSDYNRVLVTETLPGETPIIFSNEGMYRNLSNTNQLHPIQSLIVDKLIYGKGSKPFTTPLKYKIRKGIDEYRHLFLLHPIAQVQIRDFYKEYEHLILHFCSRSPISIRAPRAVASTFYRKASWENIYQYRTDQNIAERFADPFSRYSPTFFSYDGYTRVYKFFDSEDFVNLEKKFGYFWSLDVSKCFDSIYTHSLSWALKDKAFTKRHKEISSTFAQSFDRLMQRGNHQETHGIAIGPETSRIFAELIFQAVDEGVISKLASDKLLLGVDYQIRRYVDDVHIFAKTKDVAGRVYDSYSDHLTHFNLHVNSSKKKEMTRPFLTEKSRLIGEAKQAANDFIQQFLIESETEDSLEPKKIYRRDAFIRTFIQRIKSICSRNEVDYFQVSSFLISVFSERAKKFANVNLEKATEDIQKKYLDPTIILLEIMYFLYTVAPSVSASYKLCTSIVVLLRFSRQHLGDFSETVKERVYQLTEMFLTNEAAPNAVYIDGFISLEAINLLLAVRELGSNYLLPEKTLSKLFAGRKDFTYFGIISCLYYIGDDDRFKSIRMKLLEEVDSRFSDLSSIQQSSELACLFLDLISCPHVREGRKIRWIKRFYAAVSMAAPTEPEIRKFLSVNANVFWFVCWGELDLLTSLEKKELMRVY